MKKLLISLLSLFLITATLLSVGCDSIVISPGSTNFSTEQTSGDSLSPQSSTKYPPATLPSQSDSYSEQTSQSSTKYTPATIPSQSTTQTESTNPPHTDVIGGITDKDITDEELEKLITQKFLTVHKNSRPGYKLKKLSAIVIHYVANPGTSALQNWKYFENKNGVSAHFIIDLDGSILQCMPLDEVAWAIGTEEGNYSTISIECCHPDSTGEFTEATYQSLIKLVSWLCNEYGLSADDVKRHYDYPRKNSSGVIWHKQCPLYFVNHPAKWEEFKNSLLIH